MADRSIVVRLRAEVADFNRQMASAAETTRATSAGIDKNGQAIQTTMGRMARSAEINREAWTTAGTAVTAVGAAITAAGAAALKTGIEYNTLQQTSRAALSTMLGGAEAANEQMDKLDDWARNSPFAKQVFINAQRQMLGFGIEARKVLPYLDAIQNAVAAMGGSNQQISDISEILAKIASQGKITARELMQLGIHGIDAASLIGSQMDMTAGQIRESITAGSIDAMTALDALTAGMQDRFGGAAENVKNTYEGAIDRVKAAWRDLASDFATPLVDPDGGGALVDLANKLADLMRAYQALPEPVKAVHASMLGATGATALAAGGFLLLFPRIMDTVTAFRRLSRINPEVAKGIKGFAKGGAIIGVAVVGFTALTAAVEGLTNSQRGNITSSDQMTAALLRMQRVGDTLSDVFGFSDDAFGLTGSVDSLEEAARRISDPSLIDRVHDVGGSIRGIFGEGDTSRTKAIDEIGVLGEALGSLVREGHADRAADQFEMLADEWEAGGGSIEELLDLMPGYTDALAAGANASELAADSTADLTATELGLAEAQERSAVAQERLTEARAAFREEVDRWRSSMSDAFTGFLDNQGAIDSAIQKQTEWAQEQARAANEASAEWARKQEGDVKAVTKTWEDFYDGVTVSARAYIDELEAQVEAQQEWANNVTTISDRLAESFSGKDLANARAELDALAAAGPASAGVVSTLAGATDDELAEIVALWGVGGADAATEFVNAFQQSSDPFLEPRLDMENAQRTLDQWASQQVTLEVDVKPVRTDFLGRLIDQHVNAYDDALNSRTTPGSWSTPYYLPQGVRGYRDGGPISGPGTSTSDSVLIAASDREFMQSAAAHDFWGTDTMHAINDRNVDRTWSAMAARGFAPNNHASAALQVVKVPVTQRHESYAPITVHAHGADIPQIEAEAERRRLNDLGGR